MKPTFSSRSQPSPAKANLLQPKPTYSSRSQPTPAEANLLQPKQTFSGQSQPSPANSSMRSSGDKLLDLGTIMNEKYMCTVLKLRRENYALFRCNLQPSPVVTTPRSSGWITQLTEHHTYNPSTAH